MSVARNIEQRLEGLLEGFFAKLFRSGLQPVEIGRRIQREMGQAKTISVDRIYAPNDFRVVMSGDDYPRFSSMEARLRKDFTELVLDQAKQNRWNLMGLPKISFHEDLRLGKGQFKLEASLSADPDSAAPRAATHGPKDDPGATAAISLEAAERLGLAGSGAELIVLDDSGEPKERISITNSPVTIGRLTTNDVLLSDPNVSRQHAQLRQEEGRWVIMDLGSTNGTLVNGKLAKEHRLKDGDEISFGTIRLQFKLKET